MSKNVILDALRYQHSVPFNDWTLEVANRFIKDLFSGCDETHYIEHDIEGWDDSASMWRQKDLEIVCRLYTYDDSPENVTFYQKMQRQLSEYLKQDVSISMFLYSELFDVVGEAQSD